MLSEDFVLILASRRRTHGPFEFVFFPFFQLILLPLRAPRVIDIYIFSFDANHNQMANLQSLATAH